MKRKSKMSLAAERQVKERKIWLKKEPEEYQKEPEFPPGAFVFRLISPTRRKTSKRRKK